MALYLNNGWKDEEEGGALQCFPCTDTTTHDVMVGAHEEPAGSQSSSTASVQAGGGGCTAGWDLRLCLRTKTADDGYSPDVPVVVDVNGTTKTMDDGGGWTILDVTPAAGTLVLLIPSCCPTWWMKVMGSRQRIAATFV